MRKKSPESFESMVRRQEMDVFPECFPTNPDGSRHFTPPEDGTWKYLCYPPSWFADEDRRLLDPVMMERMRSGGKLLSIGAGPAYLERFLVALGAKQENIILTDLSVEIMPDSFTRHTFDAHSNNWPDFGTKFDFVIYPESFSIINGPYEDHHNGLDRPRKRSVIYGCTQEEYETFHICNMGYSTDFHLTSPGLSGTWHLIQKAIEQLNPGGEVRASLVSQHALNQGGPFHDLDYLREHLHRQFGASIEKSIALRIILPE